jgi:hypothetical protein
MGDSMLKDAMDVAGKAKDLLGLGEVGMMMGTGATDVLTPGAEKVLGPAGAALDTYTLLSGVGEMAGGLEEEYSPETWSGLGKVISGASGGLGNIPGPTGAVAKAFGAGYTLGDWMAPLVYGSEEGSRVETVPEDEIFKPTTGNAVVDWIFGV